MNDVKQLDVTYTLTDGTKVHACIDQGGWYQDGDREGKKITHPLTEYIWETITGKGYLPEEKEAE